MTELVIFDCDGVLVDSEPIAVRVDVAMLAELADRHSEDEVIERFVGRSARVIVQSVAEARLGSPAPRMAGWSTASAAPRGLRDRAGARTRHRRGARAIDPPGVRGLEQRAENLRFKLELTGLYDRFAGRLFSASEVANGKPAPDLFLYAASRMGADPPACVVIEDSRHGVQAARAAGIDVLGYVGGVMIPRPPLKGRGP